MTSFTNQSPFPVDEDQLRNWFVKNNFIKYFDQILALGVEDLGDLMFVTDDDLIQIGMGALPRKRFFAEAQAAKMIFDNRKTVESALADLETVFSSVFDIKDIENIRKQLLVNWVNGDPPAKDIFSLQEGKKRDDGSPPEGALLLHPTRSDVFVDIAYVNSTQPTPYPNYVGSFSAEGYISLLGSDQNDIPAECTFHCEAFVIPDGLPVSEEDLLYGAFSSVTNAPMKGRARERVCPLRSFQVKKTNNTISPNFVDTGGQVVSVSFVDGDKPATGLPVTGTFKLENTLNTYRFTGRTDDTGVTERCLPCGEMNLTCTSKSGKVLPIKHIIKPKPLISNPDDAPPPDSISIITNSSVYASLTSGGPFLILGDVSGSMGAGRRMENLRNTMTCLYQEAMRKNKKIALFAWNTALRLPPQIRYMTAADEGLVAGYIRSLSAGGGNDMQAAIEQSVSRFPDALDIYVMCDGDVSPFKPESWREFISQPLYAGKRFHLVALESGADHKSMQDMAYARMPYGTFTSANL